MRIRPYFTALLGATLLTACGNSEAPVSTESAADSVTLSAPALEAPPPPTAPEAPGPPTGDVASGTGSATAAPAATRKLIYHADIRIKVESLPLANAQLDSLTHTFGAYVEAASEHRENGEWTHEVKLRVAPARFQPLLARLDGLGTLESKQLRTDDVTAEHADVSARLRSKRALEQRYLALLSQARKVSEILEIEEKMSQVREDIEATESRLKTLNDEVAYSTITLTYFQLLPQLTPDTPVLSFRSRLVASFYAGWQGLTTTVLLLVATWPFLLLGGGIWMIISRWRRRRAATRQQQPS